MAIVEEEDNNIERRISLQLRPRFGHPNQISDVYI